MMIGINPGEDQKTMEAMITKETVDMMIAKEEKEVMITKEAVDIMIAKDIMEAIKVMEVTILITTHLIAMILNPDHTEAKSFLFLEILAMFLMITTKIAMFILVAVQSLKLSINQVLQLGI